MGLDNNSTTSQHLAEPMLANNSWKPPKDGHEGYPPAGPSGDPGADAAVGVPITHALAPDPYHGRPVNQALFFPADETEPRFIGARQGHSPILMHCGACDYVGTSQLRAARGALHMLTGVMTLGIVFLTPLFKDTAHHCPRCGRQVAVAKLM